MRYVENVLLEMKKNINALVNEAKEQTVVITIPAAPTVAKYFDRIVSINSYAEHVEANYRIGEISIDKAVELLESLKNHIVNEYKYNNGTCCNSTMNSIVDVINETLEDLA